MVSFYVVLSLFTNIPLDETIDMIIKRIYNKKKRNTDVPKKEMRELLYLCTGNAHFALNNKTYLQVDGVAMGSLLGPVLSNIVMVELKRNILPTLSNDISLWNRYVDEYLKEELEHIRTVFHHRNNCPLWIINKVIDDTKKAPSTDENYSSGNDKIHRLIYHIKEKKVPIY